MKNAGLTALALAAALVLGLAARHFQSRAPEIKASGDSRTFEVTYVYDGDTIKLDDGRHVRLIGIDAPEAHENEKLGRDVSKRHSSKAAQLALGREAARYAKGLLKGRRVRLEYDVENLDRYGRTLAYVYLADGTFVNEKIISDGYAYPLTIPPNVRYARLFQQRFSEAREQQRGLWQ